MKAEQLKKEIENLWNADSSTPISAEQKKLIEDAVAGLDQGVFRVAEKSANGQWTVNEWLKKAILLYFRCHNSASIHAGEIGFFDKVPVKKWNGSEGVRVVPSAIARFGSFVESGAILMPSYVNIGARVGSGTMVDTWATVGSCAQVGSNVHLSGGVGLGGVLEPVQATPVIVEDNAFIGSRCVVVEGVVIEQGAVLGAGCVITASTPIIDVTGAQEVVTKGRVPAYSVVIPGTRTKKFPAGEYNLPCALIIGQRSKTTDQKTSLTSTLRDFQVSV